MGEFEMIFRDGSGISFPEDGSPTPVEIHECDYCHLLKVDTNGRTVTAGGQSILWMCADCKEKLY